MTRSLLYLMGFLAGAMGGAGVALYLVREEGISQLMAGAFTGLVIAVFMALAHKLAKALVDEDRDTPSADLPAPLVRPAPLSAWLIPTGGGPRGAYPLSKPCTLIGRDVENDVVINSNSMSRSHAQIVRIDGTYMVLDLDSKNGTFVNNERVAQRQLHDGDELMLGSVQFRLRIEQFEGRKEPPKDPDNPDTIPLQEDPREAPTPPPAPRAREEWGSASGGGARRMPTRQDWGSDSWAAHARENFRREARDWEDRRRPALPYEPPYPPERDRREFDPRRSTEADYPPDRRRALDPDYPPERDRRRSGPPDDPTDFPSDPGPPRW